MPVLTDEIVLSIDAFVSTDPALSLRRRAESFIASREWTTNEVFYGDQAEADNDDAEPLWSFCFCLGLDKIHGTNKRWEKDVEALLAFLKAVQIETQRDIVMDVRIRSKPWYSCHIAFVDDKCPDLGTICGMIESVARPSS